MVILLTGAAVAYRLLRASDPAEGPMRKPWSLLLVTFDTTRADRLGCYGYRHGETDVLDRMARNGIRYARCTSPAPLTLPAHCTIMTGLYPFHHQVHMNGTDRLDDHAVTLAEVLRDRGYRTGAVVGAYVLDGQFGLGQGFESYDSDPAALSASSKFCYAERNAEAVTDAAIQWLDGAGDGPFFLWVHYFDPHAPYEPPGLDPTNLTGAPYDLEISYVDRQLGRLLERAGRLKHRTRRDMLLVFTADHGESLWNHGEPTHGLFVYDDVLHVPLIVFLPTASQRGTVIESPVSLADLFPSILHWLEVPMPHEVHGRVLPTSAEQVGESDAERVLYFETHLPRESYGWSELEGVVAGSYKFIRAPSPEFYDLASDPRETENLHAPGDPRARQLEAALDDLKLTRIAAPQLAALESRLDAEGVRKLQALGYMGAAPPMEDAPTRPDPKDQVRLHRRIIQAQSEIGDGQCSEALELLGTVLEADPDNPRNLLLIIDLLGEASCRSDAIATISPRLDRPLPPPFDGLLPLHLAVALAHQGRPDDAERVLERALRENPSDAEANRFLARALAARGTPAADISSYLDAPLELDAPWHDHAILLGRWYELLGRLDGAWEVYEGILARRPDEPVALNNSAWVRYRLQREPETALRRAQRAVDLVPTDASLRHTLGTVLNWLNHPADAAEHLAKAVELDPGHAAAHYQLGVAWQQLAEPAQAAEALTRALELAPDPAPEWISDARARLEKLGRRQ